MKIKMNRAGKMSTFSLLAAMTLAGTNVAAQTVQWDGGGDGINWEDPLNWAGDVLPGPANLAFNSGAANTVPGNVTLNSDQEVDALRFVRGRDLNHIGGTLTIGTSGLNNAGNPLDRTESSFPEFGDDGGTGIYTMSNGATYNQIDGGLFILGRAGTQGGQLFMSDNALMTTNGQLWFGMDAVFSGVVSDNATVQITNGGNMEIGRFVSPSSTLTFQDNANLQINGTLRMSQGTGGGVSGDSTLRLEGSSLDIDIDGLIMRELATLEFIADVGGISTIDLGGAIELLDDGGGLAPQLVVDLSLYSGTGPITLIDNTTLDAVNGEFRGLSEGAVVAGTGGLTISYVGGDGNDIVLIPEPASLALLAMGGLLMTTRRRRESVN
ncbi:MAG: PEP-CTERM sorting domain-containing protein [Planctomycetota bacterium]